MVGYDVTVGNSQAASAISESRAKTIVMRQCLLSSLNPGPCFLFRDKEGRLICRFRTSLERFRLLSAFNNIGNVANDAHEKVEHHAQRNDGKWHVHGFLLSCR